jgi:hypothetical protein
VVTDQQIYDERVNMAVLMARKATRDDIKKAAWLPFTLLYEVMIKRKEIDPFSNLSIEQKLKYWNETEGISFDTTERFKRIILCQALYVFDLLTSEQEVQECDARKA